MHGVDRGCLLAEIMVRTHDVASHYIYPVREWIMKQDDFPSCGKCSS